MLLHCQHTLVNGFLTIRQMGPQYASGKIRVHLAMVEAREEMPTTVTCLLTVQTTRRYMRRVRLISRGDPYPAAAS